MGNVSSRPPPPIIPVPYQYARPDDPYYDDDCEWVEEDELEDDVERTRQRAFSPWPRKTSAPRYGPVYPRRRRPQYTPNEYDEGRRLPRPRPRRPPPRRPISECGKEKDPPSKQADTEAYLDKVMVSNPAMEAAVAAAAAGKLPKGPIDPNTDPWFNACTHPNTTCDCRYGDDRFAQRLSINGWPVDIAGREADFYGWKSKRREEDRRRRKEREERKRDEERDRKLERVMEMLEKGKQKAAENAETARKKKNRKKKGKNDESSSSSEDSSSSSDTDDGKRKKKGKRRGPDDGDLGGHIPHLPRYPSGPYDPYGGAAYPEEAFADVGQPGMGISMPDARRLSRNPSLRRPARRSVAIDPRLDPRLAGYEAGDEALLAGYGAVDRDQAIYDPGHPRIVGRRPSLRRRGSSLRRPQAMGRMPQATPLPEEMADFAIGDEAAWIDEEDDEDEDANIMYPPGTARQHGGVGPQIRHKQSATSNLRGAYAGIGRGSSMRREAEMNGKGKDAAIRSPIPSMIKSPAPSRTSSKAGPDQQRADRPKPSSPRNRFPHDKRSSEPQPQPGHPSPVSSLHGLPPGVRGGGSSIPSPMPGYPPDIWDARGQTHPYAGYADQGRPHGLL